MSRMRPIHAPTASDPAAGTPTAGRPAAGPPQATRPIVDDGTPYRSRGRQDFVVGRRWIVGLYLLLLLGLLVLPALLAMGLAYLKRPGIEEPVLRSHLDNLIGSVWAYLGIALLAVALVWLGDALVLKLAAGVAIVALLVLCWCATKGLVRILEWRSYDGSEALPV